MLEWVPVGTQCRSGLRRMAALSRSWATGSAPATGAQLITIACVMAASAPWSELDCTSLQACIQLTSLQQTRAISACTAPIRIKNEHRCQFLHIKLKVHVEQE